MTKAKKMYQVILNGKQYNTPKPKDEAFKLARYVFDLFNQKVKVEVFL